MKLLSALVLAVAAVASGAAAAATYGSDQERRDQNREEALSRWRAAHPNDSSSDRSSGSSGRSASMRERTHDGAEKVRNTTHWTAEGVRHFTHRQAQKARHFGARQNARYGKSGTADVNTSPEGGGK